MTLLRIVCSSVFRFLADLALGLAGAYGAIAREADNFLDHLLEVNSSRIQGQTDAQEASGSPLPSATEQHHCKNGHTRRRFSLQTF